MILDGDSEAAFCYSPTAMKLKEKGKGGDLFHYISVVFWSNLAGYFRKMILECGVRLVNFVRVNSVFRFSAISVGIALASSLEDRQIT